MESISYDVVIVGAGPSGLAAAIRLKQLSTALSVCVLEKSAALGGHILSGAVMDPKALDELAPDWRTTLDVPFQSVISDNFVYLLNSKFGLPLSHHFLPQSLHNDTDLLLSLGSLTKALGKKAAGLGVDILPGYTASKLLFDEAGKTIGVETGDMGRDVQGREMTNFQQGVHILAKATFLAEGARGHLTQALLDKAHLQYGPNPPHFGLGLKELWKIPAQKHQPGFVLHGFGWPLGKQNGGIFLYHLPNNTVSLGLIADLNYRERSLDPFALLQQLKLHPSISRHLEAAERIGYGAKVINKGGLFSQTQIGRDNLVLLGCDGGFLNPARLKGIHCAIKTGMLAAEAYVQNNGANLAVAYQERINNSWLAKEQKQGQSFVPNLHKYGNVLGGLKNMLEEKFGRYSKSTKNSVSDHQASLVNGNSLPFVPDKTLTFDLSSSLYLTNQTHREDQPNHLIMKPIQALTGDEPLLHFCPAGVFENQKGKLILHPGNCLHCKTCDIKDPQQNIRWTPPEGGSGPNYRDM